MTHYLFNRQEILQKAKKTYSKEKAAEYYIQNKEAKKRQNQIAMETYQKKKKIKLKSIKRRGIPKKFNINTKS